MNGWDKVVMEYNETGKVLPCPVCGRDSLEIKDYESALRHSVGIHCKHCGGDQFYTGVTKEYKEA